MRAVHVDRLRGVRVLIVRGRRCGGGFLGPASVKEGDRQVDPRQPLGRVERQRLLECGERSIVRKLFEKRDATIVGPVGLLALLVKACRVWLTRPAHHRIDRTPGPKATTPICGSFAT